MLRTMNAVPNPDSYSREQAGPRIEIAAPWVERSDEALTPLALQLLASLHRRFNLRRLELLAARQRRQEELDSGVLPEFLPGTAALAAAGSAAADWQVAPPPADLRDRRIELAGPPERQTLIHHLNAPVQAVVADFEDACSPTWENLIQGQVNLQDALRGTLSVADRGNGKIYRLAPRIPTLIVRPRGWHLTEKHVQIAGEPVSAALFDFALYLANNHELLARRGTGPYFYLPKLENHLEARLWNDVFIAAQDALNLPRGTIRATVLVETILAAFEMDEILAELREHCVGLNCGRWDYLFSFIKCFRNWPDFVLPDRRSVTMHRHFMHSYVDLLIKICHHRGAHAMGGMAAQIPNRTDAVANDVALSRVRADKLREASAGHDGTWIAHPGLAQVTREAFDTVVTATNQLGVLRPDVSVSPADLLKVPDGEITDAGLRGCIRVGVQYLESWLRGIGCVPIGNVMEDVATAEICRAQWWQWLRHEACTQDGRLICEERFNRLLTDELDAIHDEVGAARLAGGVYPTAARLFANMVKSDTFDEFLTLSAYEHLT